MGDLLGQVWLYGMPVAFLIGVFTIERMEGRAFTGEPDFEQSAILALMWPLALIGIVLGLMVLMVVWLCRRALSQREGE